MSATPPTLALDRRNVLTWDYRIAFLGSAPHSLISGDDFTSPAIGNEGSSGDGVYTRGFGRWDFTTTADTGNARIFMPGRCAGPSWVAYVIVDAISKPASGVNVLDVGVNLFNGVTSESKTIRARLWNTDANQTVSVTIDQSPANADSGEWGTTAFVPPSAPFALALVCNLNSLAVAIGDANGKNFKIASGWRTLTAFDMAAPEILFGDPGADGNGGLSFGWYCESATVGSHFGITRAEWRYWDGVGTRETYLLSDLDGCPIIDDGRVWMTTDRTLPYDPSQNFLPNGAQMTVCKYDPSNGRLGEETARFFYKADGRIVQAQNSKLVFDSLENAFHCYVPDWKNSPGWVGMLYARVDYADLRYGVHVLEPLEMTLPTGEHFDPSKDPTTGDALYDASLVRIAPNDYLLLLSWSDISRGFPNDYTRVMFRGSAPNAFTEIVGWDNDHGGEGHRIVRVGGKLWAICGSLERNRFHTWEIVPGAPGENWMSYVSETEITGFNWGRGDVPTYPAQPEIFGLRAKDGIKYHFTTFGIGQFDPSMNATTGSFFSARSQEFAL